MDIRKIKKLIELVEESGIAELEISEGEESVRISRNFSGQVSVAPQMMMQAGTGSTSRRSGRRCRTGRSPCCRCRPRVAI